MKKKLLLVLISLVCVICCAFGLTACGDNDSGSGGDKAHTHSYGAEWVTDKDSHWHECKNDGCDDKIKDKTAHCDNDNDGKCDICNYVIRVIHTHSLTPVEAKEADCISEGNLAYFKCGCGKWFYDKDGKTEIEDKTSVVIVRTKHLLTEVPANESDCNTNGNTAYYTCGGCNKWFADKDGKTEITDKASVILPLKHPLIKVDGKEENCTNDGNIEYYICSGCDKWFLDKDGKTEIADKTSVVISKRHRLTLTAANASTCTTEGNIEYYTCSGCDKWFSDKDGITEIADKTSVITVKIAHSYENGGCKVCGKAQATEGLEYTDKGDYYEVSGLGTATDTDIVIAEEYNGKSVTSIGDRAFYDCNTITSITVPDCLESVGYNAFYGCANLTYENYSTGSYIGSETNPYLILVKVSGAASGCLINEETKIIASKAFSGCVITDVQIPDSVTFIGAEAFYNCTRMTKVTLSRNLTYLGGRAFDYCWRLENITFYSKIKFIGEDAFNKCSALKWISYYGTVAQWALVEKGSGWKGAHTFKVGCSDGQA